MQNIIDKKSLTIHGDGMQTRDFIFVKDVVDANIFAAEKQLLGEYNIASGQSVNIKKLAEILLEANNKHN